MTREERIGLNEALFRQINERIGDLSVTLEVPHLEIVCECGEIECTERFEIAQSAYEELRSDPTLFAIVPGHEQPDVEDVVERAGSYVVVRKHSGNPSKLADATDPRS